MDVRGGAGLLLVGLLIGAGLGWGWADRQASARAQVAAVAVATQNLNELRRFERASEEQTNGYRSDLAALRAWYRGRVVTVPGCGGTAGLPAGDPAGATGGTDDATERGGFELVAAGTAEACGAEALKLMRLQAYERGVGP